MKDQVEFVKQIATKAEPPPKPGTGPSCHDIAVNKIESYPEFLKATPKLRFLTVEALKARRDLGAEKYGTVLQKYNGRRPTADAVQELLDALAYMAQAGLEDTVHFKNVAEASEFLLASLVRKESGKSDL